MISLSEKELDLGLEILKWHGYGDFFPKPPEFDILSKGWASFRKHLSTLDLEKYEGYQPIEISAPKSRISLRRVALLHPFDAVIYSALVGLVRDSIAADRVPESEQSVFSFRSEGAHAHALYKPRPSHPEFAARVLAKAAKSKRGYMALADVADFYRRLYQHRVRNAVEATIKDPVRSRYAEIIEKRLLRTFSGGNSYGIPIGPAASRPLAEAAMIDVDSALQSHNIDFVRYIDDFALFAGSREAAEWSVRQLGEILLSNHGLALQTAKTHVMSCEEYIKRHQADSEEDEVEKEFNEIVEEHFYDIDSIDDLTEDQKDTIDVMDFAAVLESALGEDSVSYKKVSFILGKLSSLQNPDLIPIVLENLELLYPVAHSVNEFFREFEHLPVKEQKKIGDALLAPLLPGAEYRAPEYYAMWALDLFARNESWNHARTLMKIFRETESQVIRRYSALAIGKCGSRAEALIFREHIGAAEPMTRTAILISSAKLPKDERSHWRRSLRLSDPFEKQIP